MCILRIQKEERDREQISSLPRLLIIEGIVRRRKTAGFFLPFLLVLLDPIRFHCPMALFFSLGRETYGSRNILLLLPLPNCRHGLTFIAISSLLFLGLAKGKRKHEQQPAFFLVLCECR